MPTSNLGFRARLQIGDITLEKETRGSTIEFDEGVPQGEAEITVWREAASGLAGPTTTITRSPSYEAIDLPAPRFISWERTGGVLRVELGDPVLRGVQGCDFRYTTAALGTTNDLAAITEAGWDAALRFDSQRVLLQPGLNAIFNCTYTSGARYRIFARFVDSVGRLGPVSELGQISLNPPASDLRSQDGAPDWAGSLKNLYDFPTGTFGSAQPLIPNRNDLPALLTRGEWEGVPESTTDAVTRWEYRYRTDGGTYGAWQTIAAGLRTATITSLTNGQRYDVQFRAVREDSGNSAANTLQARPVAAAVVPPAPTLSQTKVDPTAITMRSVITGNVSANAPVLRHQYRIGTTAQNVSSATWTTISNSASKEVTFMVSSLPQNATRYVQVRAVNSVGNSAVSNTVTAVTRGNGGSGSKFGSWESATPDDPATIFRQVADVDETTDGLFRAQAPWKKGGPNSEWWGYYQWTDGNTQHQIRTLAYSSRNHRSRTRTSREADWGAWSAWGVADSYRAADLNDFTSGVAPGIFSPNGQSGTFAKSGNGFRASAPSYVRESIWFIFNETTGTGANRETHQVAVKFYRDNGYNNAFRYRRKAQYVTASTPVTSPPTYGTWTRDTSTESGIVRQEANPDNAADGPFRQTAPWQTGGSQAGQYFYYQWTTGNTQHQLRTHAYSGRNYRSRTRANASAAWGSWGSWGSTAAFETTNLTPYQETGGRLFRPHQTSNDPESSRPTWFNQSYWTEFYDSANSQQVAMKFYRDSGFNGTERWTRSLTFPNPIPGSGGTAAAPGKSTIAAAEE